MVHGWGLVQAGKGSLGGVPLLLYWKDECTNAVGYLGERGDHEAWSGKL